MILKGSQRGGGQDLAVHLMRTDQNEHVRLHETRGFMSDDLRGAFKEAEAISRVTKCRQFLFSLSLSPPEREKVPVDVFEQAIERIEARLGLEGQPRAIVFHEKEGRRHAHCVWSRIDAQSMTARPLSFFKRKLVGVSRELYLEQGWTMPRGLVNAAERNPTNFTLAEWQQAKRQGIDPRWLKQTLQDCWARSDNRRAFVRGLEEHGFFLAKGDKRSFVVVDHAGEVHSLPRALGLKTKDVKDRMGDDVELSSVAEVKRLIGERMSAAMRRHIDEARAEFRARVAVLDRQRVAMTIQHRNMRRDLDQRLDDEWKDETRERMARLPTGLRGLWHRITGRYQEVRGQNEAEAKATRLRHAQEGQKVIEAQLHERSELQREFKTLRQQQAAQLLDLRRDVGRYLGFVRTGDEAGVRRRGDEFEFNLRR
jgi:hypothetical protein